MTIPSSELVSVTPSVLSAGGLGVATTGLILTTSTRVPIGQVLSFPSALAVSNYFGASSVEAQYAAVYFAGFSGASQTPSSLLFAQYPQSAVAAYLRGGNISGISLTALQSYSGSLDVTIDGYPRNASSISLAAATSFTSAASIIQAALNAADPTEATFTASIGASFTGAIASTTLTASAVTGIISVGDTASGAGVAANTTIVSQLSGTPGGAGTYQVSNSQTVSSEAMTTTSNVLDVTAVASGTIAPGQSVTGSGVTEVVITGQLTGTAGGVGTYSLAGSPQNVASESMTAVGTPVVVSYDPQSGAFVITSGITGTGSTAAFATGTLAANLLLTQATGAVLSQGAAAATPAAFMNALIQVNQNWVAFATDFDPDNGNGSTVRQAFAAWKNTALGSNRFCYVCRDTDPTAAASVPATASLGYILANNGDSGTCLVWEPAAGGDLFTAAFVLGIIASINFNQTNGRVAFAYKAQAGLVAGVTDPTTATNLAGNPQSPGSFGNGYNFYGAYATAGQNNTWFQRGFVTGLYQWLDSYINQIWLNSQFQNALLTLFGNARSVPFSNAGAALLSSALMPSVQQGLSFGAYGPGTLTAAQEQEVNQATGNQNAAGTIASQGWYLQIVPATTAIQASRGPQQINFYYFDQGAVQSISLSSVEVQA